ncbi:MBL fold metallo-hydrolase [Saccharibacter sp. 17.LH.SD]|uniref:MBL fold metallo-hydrolase n=1 Tax=Saccharibacter sp. 17.LH.SD TaxID=2689393 RepID=UPI00136EC644|nr:MBL fold metallo-hydrolase [Saccharibacter sp. 17.LH.SD]MXV44552.1 MBL fold metallo-hydrolase [Saccharibacter sp. 17.LH.SD]
MKVTILGCGGSPGVPMIGGAEGEGALTGIWGDCDPQNPKNRRTRSSIILEQDGFRLLVDSGPDFRRQMLSCGLNHVDGVLYTHAHSDHIAGVDELRAVNRVIERPLPLKATAEVLSELKARFDYAFRPWEGGEFYRPAFEVEAIAPDGPIVFGPLKGEVFPQHHGRVMSLGMRFGSVAYCTDVKHFPEGVLDRLKGLDLWIVGCLQYHEHPAHAWLERVLEWREIIRPKRTILTHMGPDMDYATLRKTLPEGVEPAWDGMVLEV